MNSTEDVLQVRFMHDRMMVQHEVERLVVWQAITRFTKVRRRPVLWLERRVLMVVLGRQTRIPI